MAVVRLLAVVAVAVAAPANVIAVARTAVAVRLQIADPARAVSPTAAWSARLEIGGNGWPRPRRAIYLNFKHQVTNQIDRRRERHPQPHIHLRRYLKLTA